MSSGQAVFFEMHGGAVFRPALFLLIRLFIDGRNKAPESSFEKKNRRLIVIPHDSYRDGGRMIELKKKFNGGGSTFGVSVSSLNEKTFNLN